MPIKTYIQKHWRGSKKGINRNAITLQENLEFEYMYWSRMLKLRGPVSFFKSKNKTWLFFGFCSLKTLTTCLSYMKQDSLPIIFLWSWQERVLPVFMSLYEKWHALTRLVKGISNSKLCRLAVFFQWESPELIANVWWKYCRIKCLTQLLNWKLSLCLEGALILSFHLFVKLVLMSLDLSAPFARCQLKHYMFKLWSFSQDWSFSTLRPKPTTVTLRLRQNNKSCVRGSTSNDWFITTFI